MLECGQRIQVNSPSTELHRFTLHETQVSDVLKISHNVVTYFISVSHHLVRVGGIQHGHEDTICISISIVIVNLELYRTLSIL
jgi:hypothetical protein